eukprot:gene6059-6761_t
MSTEDLSPTIARIQKSKIDRMPSLKGRPNKNFQSSNLQGLPHEELINFLCILEAEVQARDMIISAVTRGEIGSALPLSHLLSDTNYAKLIKGQDDQVNDDDDDLWLGEPTAHLNHVVAYHQLVREQMQSMMQSLQEQHKTILQQLENEQRKHAIDTAQGDEVTYMLEKERERLTNEIEFEQGKLLKVEKERDRLQMTIEKERDSQQQEFNLLLNDCKMFAKQLVEQAQKEEQLSREVEQEKRKTRLLSELMVEEQKKYKEKLKGFEDERKEKQILIQQKKDLEIKLSESEKSTKEAHQKYAQESMRVKALECEVKQLKTRFSKYSSESSENGDEFVIGERQPPIVSRDAKISQPPMSDASLYQQEEDEMFIPPSTANTSTKIATVVKSNEAQNKGFVSKSKPESPVRSAKSTKIASLSPKTIAKPPNSNVLEEGTSRKVPPPTPPRVSSITARSVPVLPSDNDGFVSTNPFVRSNSVGAAISNRSPTEGVTRYERRQTMGTRSDRVLIDVAVVNNFGWEYTKEEGLHQSRRVVDFLGQVTMFQNSSWGVLTESINKLFVENFPSRIWQDQNRQNSGLTLSSIKQYGLLDAIWTHDYYPIGFKPWELCINRREMILTVWLKDENTANLDSLAYSTATPIYELKEYCRLIQKYKNILLVADDCLEAKHFVSCLSNWLKLTDENKQRRSIVTSIEESEITNEKDLISRLLDQGVLIKSGAAKKTLQSTIVLIDVDFVTANHFSSDILLLFDKRGPTANFSNELDVNSTEYSIHEDVIVLAYASRSSTSNFQQGIYKVFKVVELPPAMPLLLQRWLRQKAYLYTKSELDVKELEDWVRWISDVYRRTSTDLERLDIELELLDIGLFLSAPTDDPYKLKNWAEELWTHHFYRIIERSIKAQVVEASKSQQDLLMQVALKTFFENALLPGCPARLDI